MSSPYQKYAQALRSAGFTPLPIAPNAKKPVHSGWSKFLETPPSDETYAQWQETYNSTHAVGVLTGKVIGIDVDVYEKDASIAVAKMILEKLGNAPKRIGMAPKVLLLYRNEGEFFSKMDTGWFEKEGFERSKIEILAKGQQFVAYGIHPDTGKPYRYKGEDLLDFTYDFLEEVTPAQLEEILEAAAEILESHGWQRVSRGNTGNTVSDRILNAAVIDDVDFPLDQPEKIKSALRCIDPDDYDTWYKMGMALHSTMAGQEAFEIWNDWSAESAKYDADEMQYKWSTFAHVESGVSIGSLFHLAMENGWVEEEDFEERPSSMQGYIDRYWFMENSSMVVDEIRPPHEAVLKLQDFKNSHLNNTFIEQGPRGPNVIRFADRWMASAERKTLKGETYIPKGQRIVWKQGLAFFNTYCGPDRVQVPEVDPARIQTFLDHVAYLTDSTQAYEHVLNWCAINVQRPDIKLPFALLLYSPHHGVGKGLFAETMGHMVGNHNTSTCSAEQLSGQGSSFNEYMDKAVLTLVHEIRGKNRFDMTDRIKNLITEKVQHVNVKYGAQRTQEVFNNFLFMSNHEDAVAITDEDRRIDIIQIDEEARDASYYEAYAAWQADETNLNHLYTWLMIRDLNAFNPSQRPEMTGAKKSMIDASKSDLEAILFDAIDTGDGPFARDVVQATHIYNYLADELGFNHGLFRSQHNEVRHALARYVMARYPERQRDYKKYGLGVGKQVKINGTNVRLLILRNIDIYIQDGMYNLESMRKAYNADVTDEYDL